jgi:hypothetical protein
MINMLGILRFGGDDAFQAQQQLLYNRACASVLRSRRQDVSV